VDANVSSDRIAVLIDADNTRPSYAEALLSEVAKYGTPTIKRVYGDWTNPHLTQWSRKLNSMGLRAMHQNAFTMGKNSTDLALVIDAMDLLYDDNVEAFALVTSDSDFTSLAHRLRESGKTVYVLGENKAPDALKYACDKFIDLEVVHSEERSDDDQDDEDDDRRDDARDDARDDTEATAPPTFNLQSALTRAINAVSDDDGWASLGALGNQLNRTHPSFDARTFGGSAARLSTLVAAQPYLETSGTGNGMRVRRKGTAPAKDQPRSRGRAAAVEEAPKSAAPKVAAKKAVKKATAATKVAAEKVTPAKGATAEAAPVKKAAPSKAAPPKKAAEKPVVRQTRRD
jgi:uncharacterized protein (TIGR00288 family)